MKYPYVWDEFATIAMCLHGFSLARFGDGELKILYGAGYNREPENPALTAEMRDVLVSPHTTCMVGIPTMDPRGPKYTNWTRHIRRFEGILPEGRPFVSAFVSRPDSAPWINTRHYALSVEALWADKRAAVVCERKGSMFGTVRMGAATAVHIECPHTQAYAHIDALEESVMAVAPDIAVLAAGPTATCLANRLAKRGLQAIDLGSAGGFLRRLLETKPS